MGREAYWCCVGVFCRTQRDFIACDRQQTSQAKLFRYYPPEKRGSGGDKSEIEQKM